MLENVKFVIGSNFGDEGKGLVTNYFCEQARAGEKKCVNILTNGGSQRAHTVEFLDGKRHVFQHFGSGTFTGATTFLSGFFIVNPITFRTEHQTLLKLGEHPIVICDFHCRFSTPWDMIVNQIVEASRGEGKHGSCGMGIWETVDRYGTKNGIAVADMAYLSRESRRLYLSGLRDNYFKNRLEKYGIKQIPDEWSEIWHSLVLLENFLNDLEYFFQNVQLEYSTAIRKFDTAVFENGQGLLLSNPMYGNNTTPSNTGATYGASILWELGLENVKTELCYVSRTYMTRHGAGDFITESKSSTFSGLVDKTNISNPFQGSLRYGDLNTKGLFERVRADSEEASRKLTNVKTSIIFTHTNELGIDLNGVNCSGIDAICGSDSPFPDSIKKI